MFNRQTMLLVVGIGASLLGSCAEPIGDADSKVAARGCTPIAGGDTAVLARVVGACVGCSSLQPDNSIDGDMDTFATVTIPVAVAGGYSIRAIAQTGVVFPAGSVAGVSAEILKAASVAVMTGGSVRTFLGDELQDESEIGGEGVVEVNGVGNVRNIFTVTATQPFDSVEFTVNGNFNGYTLRVFEFCSNTQ